MLRSLHIENIAVIEKADIEFFNGFNVMTGETGAGKSIVIDSLNAVLGGRTSRELVRHGADRAMVTAVFDSEGAEQWLEENYPVLCFDLAKGLYEQKGIPIPYTHEDFKYYIETCLDENGDPIQEKEQEFERRPEQHRGPGLHRSRVLRPL